jgi:hypothetical protein
MTLFRWMFAALLAVSAPAMASGKADMFAEKGKPPIDQVVKIKVWTVHATNKSDGVGEGLDRISKHLGNLNYTGFSLLSKDGAPIAIKNSKKFPIVGEKAVKVTVLERNEKRARVRVQVTSPKGKLLDTTVSIRRNGFFMVAGPRHKKGVLVLPIFARY